METVTNPTINYAEAINQTYEHFVQNPMPDSEIDKVYEALMNDPRLREAIASCIASTSEKFLAVSQGGFRNKEDALQSIITRGVAGPMLDMMVFGYKVGKQVQSAESLENMFGKSVSA